MITTFKTHRRSFAGGQGESDFKMQVDVAFRTHLHRFKGAKLAVFMAIALHANDEGWSWPSLALLRDETGYNVQTISEAITELCAMQIDGHHVMIAVQYRGEGRRFASNRYLVLPSDADVQRYSHAQRGTRATEAAAD